MTQANSIPPSAAVSTRPVLGAALPIERLAEYRDWLLEHGGRDLEIQDGFLPEVLDGDWKPRVAQAQQVLEGYTGRLGIHGPYDGYWLATSDPALRRFIAGRYRRALAFAADLGASHMVLHSPFLFFGHPQVAHTPAAGLAQQLDYAHDTLQELLPIAQDLGLTLVIENIRDTHPAPLLELVRSFDSPQVRMSLDTGHAYLMHQIGGPPPSQWVHTAGQWLGHVHLQDNDGLLDRHWQPGQGNVHWASFFEALAQSPAQPRLILEVRGHQVLPAATWLTQQGLAI
ncbi:MAG: sugar phosphate isomerase/epimerase [Meiothermus sp.]